MDQVCQQNFEQLKHLLTTSHVLNIVDPIKEFMVCTYAFQEGVWAILIQDGKVIVYESQMVKEHEKKHFVYDFELIYFSHALKVSRNYLLGKAIFLMIEHNILKSYFKQPNLNVGQARWNSFLREFEFDSKHLKGKENHVSKALTRRVHYVYELHDNQIEF